MNAESPLEAPLTTDPPTEIRRLTAQEGAGTGLSITFLSGRSVTLVSRILREGCPCASCAEARGSNSHQTPLGGSSGKSLLRVIRSSSEQQLDLQSVWQVGSYAIGIRWGDGHDSGIFTFQQLNDLAAASDH